MSKVLRSRHLSCLRRFYSSFTPIVMNYTLWEPSVDTGAPPILIMHGLMGSQENWRTVARNLVARLNRKIYTLDVRNHGSSPHTKEFSFRHIAADLHLLTQMLGLHEVVALGHSMGGLSMIAFSLTHPELVERLIVVDVSPFGLPTYAGISDEMYDFLINVDLPQAGQTLGLARRQLRREMLRIGGNMMVADFLLKNLRKQSNGEFYWACNFESMRDNWHEFTDFRDITLWKFAPYNGPTLFIAGTKSDFVPHSHVPEIRSYFPKVKFDWVNSYHLVHAQRPREFVESVCNFVDY